MENVSGYQLELKQQRVRLINDASYHVYKLPLLVIVLVTPLNILLQPAEKELD